MTNETPPLPGGVRLDRDVDLPGARLKVHDWAGGRGPVVCLPGQFAGGRIFEGLARSLAPEWRVMAVNPRGRGGSAAPRREYGYQMQAVDALAVIDRFGFERPVLVGHGFGALVGLLIAAWYPDLPRGLVLIDGGDEALEAGSAGMEQFVKQLDAPYSSEDAFLDQVRRISALQPWSSEIEAYVRDSLEVVPGGGVRMRVSQLDIEQETRNVRLSPPDYGALQAAVRCPTLVVRAGRDLLRNGDVMLGEGAYRGMLARLRDARGVVAVDANHFTMLLGQSESTIDAVRGFLAELAEG